MKTESPGQIAILISNALDQKEPVAEWHEPSAAQTDYNARKIPENLIRERDTIGEISDAEAKLHTGYPEATEETPSLREGDIVRTRQRRSHAESMEFAQEAYAVTQSAVQNYPRKVLETYNKNVGLPQYRKKAKQVAKPKIQTRISEVYDRLQDMTASTYKETALERKIFESYRRPLRNVFNLNRR